MIKKQPATTILENNAILNLIQHPRNIYVTYTCGFVTSVVAYQEIIHKRIITQLSLDLLEDWTRKYTVWTIYTFTSYIVNGIATPYPNEGKNRIGQIWQQQNFFAGKCCDVPFQFHFVVSQTYTQSNLAKQNCISAIFVLLLADFRSLRIKLYYFTILHPFLEHSEKG